MIKNEITGIIIELINHHSGYILGNDNIKYFFSTIDYLESIETKINTKVIFKPKYFSNINQYKATMISKNN